MDDKGERPPITADMVTIFQADPLAPELRNFELLERFEVLEKMEKAANAAVREGFGEVNAPPFARPPLRRSVWSAIEDLCLSASYPS